MEDEQLYSDFERNEKVKAEIKKLTSIFSKIDLKTKKAVRSLIENAAFMSVTLAELQEHINKNGVTEKYTNGANQSGIKKSSHVEVYNTMIKNHTSIIKQLTDLLPKPPVSNKEKGDGFDEFVNGRDD